MEPKFRTGIIAAAALVASALLLFAAGSLRGALIARDIPPQGPCPQNTSLDVAPGVVTDAGEIPIVRDLRESGGASA
jgi:hypothetical protein